MSKIRRKHVLWGSACLALSVWLIWGNTSLQVDRFTVSDSRIPEAFSGLRIAQVSDLHNAVLGQGNERLLNLLAREGPDIILITGDRVDSRRTDVDVAYSFVREAAKLAPVYYVPGNHEQRLDYSTLRTEIAQAGAIILDNEKCVLARENQTITLLGVQDPNFSTPRELKYTLKELVEDETGYTILLSHRPELMDIYSKAGVCLVFSGHAHGGQIRLPGVGGVLVPDQGFFPQYDSGMHWEQNTCMLVSRGLGDSIFPLRIGNRRSLLVAELVRSEQDGKSS